MQLPFTFIFTLQNQFRPESLKMDPNSTSNHSTRIPPPRGYALSGKVTLTAVVVLFTVALLVLFTHLFVRWHVQRRRQSLRQRNLLRRQHHLVFAPPPVATSAPRGLDPKVLNSLSTLVFSSKEIDGVAECAVCLSEFEKGEVVRVLPRCDHGFHVQCIDMWFGSHNSCPLCRSAIKPPPLPPPPTGSTSVPGNGEVRIDIRSGEELGLGFGLGSEEKGRILAIMRFLSRREVDLERGEVAERRPPAE